MPLFALVYTLPHTVLARLSVGRRVLHTSPTLWLPLAIKFVRCSVLLGGGLYGIAHRRTLQREADATKLTYAAHDREHLVTRAKEAWATKQADKGSDSLITNPDDPKFDIEKLVAQWEKDLA